MIRRLRHIGIAIGSLVIAWLAVSLVAGPLLGPTASGNILLGLVIVILGGLIYVDIIRRDRRAA
jgi:hypothetical protein